MNVNKQTREYIALGVLLVVLAIAIVFFLQSNKPKPVTKNQPAETKQEKKVTPASSQTAANSRSWVTDEKARIPGLIDEVRGGRNPFKDLMMPVMAEGPESSPNATPSPLPGPIIPTGADRSIGNINQGSLPPLELETEQTVTLRWISWQQAATVLKKEGITDVTVSPGKKAGTARFSGPEVSVRDALDNIIARLDVEPPAPDFQLRGVITTASANMAVISVSGKTYSLYQGDTIPGVGWTVKEVTASSVTLTKKGYTAVTRRLAGGKA
ncbi:MAG: hypothetical protein ACYDCO_02125 [Armatimonadota bacterium]